MKSKVVFKQTCKSGTHTEKNKKKQKVNFNKAYRV